MMDVANGNSKPGSDHCCVESRIGHRCCDGWGISAIAYDAGFGDVSYFNRTFRRPYGVTPSEVREAAQRPK
jgi:AraC-like DNA-binding protein